MSDTEILNWLNYWLVSFRWNSDDRLCHLTFQDPGQHHYKATGKDLRECVENAVKAEPTSLTFIKPAV